MRILRLFWRLGFGVGLWGSGARGLVRVSADVSIIANDSGGVGRETDSALGPQRPLCQPCCRQQNAAFVHYHIYTTFGLAPLCLSIPRLPSSVLLSGLERNRQCPEIRCKLFLCTEGTTRPSEYSTSARPRGTCNARPHNRAHNRIPNADFLSWPERQSC